MISNNCHAWALLAAVWLGAAASGDELRIAPTVLSVIDESQVAAEEAGVVRQLHVSVGQTVQIGDKLAQLDDSNAELQLQRARIDHETALQATSDVNVRSARVTLTLAELDLKRAREAVDRYAKSISDAQIDRLEVIVERARLDVEQAEQDATAARLAADAAMNNVEIMEHGVQRRCITAPVSGTVVAVEARQGEWVDAGETVVRIVNIDRLRAEAFVAFNRLSGPIESEVVTFTTLGQQIDADFYGTVTFVSPEVNRVNGQVRLWAEIENMQHQLRPGMSGTMVIRTPHSDAKSPIAVEAAPSESPGE